MEKIIKNKVISSEIDISIPFYDLDPMNIVWHGNYVKYLEDARCKLLDEIGYNYETMKDFGYAWPIIELKIKYIAPLTFMQKITICATITEYENRLKIDYKIKDKETNKPLTKAYTKQVAFNMKTNEMNFCSPDHFIKKVENYV